MPITNHTGLPRSGKSYDVVVRSMIPAARDGRRILTSITGVNAALLAEEVGRPVVVRFMTKAEIIDPLSYPSFDDASGDLLEPGLVIRPGDFIAWDEIHRYWKDSSRVADEMPERIREFFRYHGKIDTVIHLITHSPDDLPPFIRRVVDATIDTVNMRNLGMGQRYRRIVYARDKHDLRLRLGQKPYKYQKRHFHLYKSFSHGNETTVTAAATSSTFKFALLLALGGPLVAVCIFVAMMLRGGDAPAAKAKPGRDAITLEGPVVAGGATPAKGRDASAQAPVPSATAERGLLSIGPADDRPGTVQQVAQAQPSGASPLAPPQQYQQVAQQAPQAAYPPVGYQYPQAYAQPSYGPPSRPRRVFGSIEVDRFKGQMSDRSWKCPTSGDTDTVAHDPRCE